MLVLVLLILWLAALLGLTVYFSQKMQTTPQRIFSFFLIVWALLAVAYYDVWLLLTYGEGIRWFYYLPILLFAVCAGVGVAYLVLSLPRVQLAMQQRKIARKLTKQSHEKIPRPRRKDKRKK